MADIRELIFQKNGSDKVTAGIYTDSDGIVSGIPAALKKAEETGLSVTYAVHEGEDVFAGDMLMEFSGIPTQICTAEDSLISEISKYSGVATAARAFSRKVSGRAKIVCGSWKKMPGEIKNKLRQAMLTGGVSVRCSSRNRLCGIVKFHFMSTE